MVLRPRGRCWRAEPEHDGWWEPAPAEAITRWFGALPADGRWSLPVRLQRGAERYCSAAGQTKPSRAACWQQGEGLGAVGQRLRLRLRPQRVRQKLPQWGGSPGAGGAAQHGRPARLDRPWLRPLQGGCSQTERSELCLARGIVPLRWRIAENPSHPNCVGSSFLPLKPSDNKDKNTNQPTNQFNAARCRSKYLVFSFCPLN